MKKLMIGILILIPIIILLIVAMVSSIISINAWVSVEDITLNYKGQDSVAHDLSFSLENVSGKVLNLYDYIDVKVMPEKANNYTVEWQIVGDVTYTDEDYQNRYEAYAEKYKALSKELEGDLANNGFSGHKKELYNTAKALYGNDSVKIVDYMAVSLLGGRVYPAVSFVDFEQNDVSSNNTGELVIASYCNFTIKVSAENVHKTLLVSVVGDTVEKVSIGILAGDSNVLNVGESKRIVANYTPIDSIVEHTIWQSDNESVVVVDQNGVITAVGKGVANITVKASKHSSENEYVESEPYKIVVNANAASSVYGAKITTSASSLTLTELGLPSDSIATEGCTIDANGNISITANRAVITTSKGAFEIIRCEEGSIEIENKEFYRHDGNDSDFVLGVGEQGLKLKAVFADALANGTPQGVSWQSSDRRIAVVNENGEVSGVASGIVTITASLANGQSATIELNVRSKLTSVRLRTSDSSLAVGLARETVFASYKYVDANVADALVANSVDIIIHGEPDNEDELETFYGAYKFEIVQGSEYASFDNKVANRLVFDSDKLEGNGKQQIVVRVSAKYPKYESLSKFTTEDVTINAIYGIAVSDMTELERATEYQKEYAYRKDNNLGSEISYDMTAPGGRFVVHTLKGSKATSAICFEDNIAYRVDENGDPIVVGYWENVEFYGDVYGNNKMLSALQGQIEYHMARFAWSNITVSNIILRANNIGDNAEITDAEDTASFTGETALVEADDCKTYHLENVRFEYTIFENGTKAFTNFNAETTIDGCIMRNFVGCGMYVPHRMYWKEAEKTYVMLYSHIDFNNFTASNLLGSLMSIVYERYTVTEARDDGKGGTQVYGRFVPDDLEANEQFFLDTLYADGINLEIRQTGFFNLYNWQDAANANIIDVGDDSLNDMIGTMSGSLLTQNSAFKDFLYKEKSEEDDTETDWFHLAFICTGISTSLYINNSSEMVFDEPTYLKLMMDVDDIGVIDSKDLEPEGNAVAKTAASFLKTCSLQLYGYKNTNVIKPHDSYQITPAFIDKLHK